MQEGMVQPSNTGHGQMMAGISAKKGTRLTLSREVNNG
jgi:hypothetical protein